MGQRRRFGPIGRTAVDVPTVTAESRDGFVTSAYDQGSGPATVIIVGGGLDDGRGYGRLADQLSNRYRVLRVIRRQYRADAEPWRPVDIEDEASDVVALARTVNTPCYLFGHSSGAVVALEAALAAPDRFGALAVFEPAIDLVELPLGRRESTVAARRAVDAGHAGQALEIFLRDMVGMPRSVAKLSRVLAFSPRYRSQLIPGQIADQEAVERLGDRLTAYAGITSHVLVIVGTKSPAHLPRRAEVLQDRLRSSDLRRMDGASHGAPVSKAVEVSELLIADIEDRLGEARHR